MSRKPNMEVMIEDARIVFRNFAGEEKQYNTAGERNFAILLPNDVADQMSKDGWNIRILEAREEGEEDQPYIQVKVSYKFKPPRVTMLSSTARTTLVESTIEILDYADMDTVDVLIEGVPWDVNGKTGIKAYLRTMFVTVREDALERKYAQIELERERG